MVLFRYLRRKKASLLVILLAVFVFIFTSPYLSILKLTFVQPLKFPVYLVSFFTAEFKALISYRANSIENIKLKNENNALQQRLIKFGELIEENSRLSGLLSFKKDTNFSLVAARVIGRDSANWANSLLIDKGASAGIKEGQLVITDLGLVGMVAEAAKDLSRVMLISDPNFNIAGVIQRSRETGIVSGSLLGRCMMRYLDGDADIAKGDLVLTLGLSENYPKGIIIGEVIGLSSEDNGISMRAMIKPKVKLSALEEVLVIR